MSSSLTQLPSPSVRMGGPYPRGLLSQAPVNINGMSYSRLYHTLQSRSADWNFSLFRGSVPTVDFSMTMSRIKFQAAGLCEVLAHRGGKKRHVQHFLDLGFDQSLIDLWRQAPVERPKEIIQALGSMDRSRKIEVAREFLDLGLHAKQEVGISLRVAAHYAREAGMTWRDLVRHYQATRTPYEEKLIADLQENGGIMSFDHFFNLAMYGAMGTYTSETAHHLITSSEDKDRKAFFKTDAEDPALAEAFLHHARVTWERLGKPREFTLMEMGAGMGTLARNILSMIQQLSPEDPFRRACHYKIVEISAELAQIQRKLLSPFERVAVECRSVIDGPLPRLENGFVFSNELVDMFPMRKIARAGRWLQESYVVFCGGVIQEVMGPARSSTRDRVKDWGLDLENGETYYLQPAIDPWVANVSEAMQRGVMVTIDYGGLRSELREKRHDFGKFLFKGYLQKGDPKSILNDMAVTTYRDSITGVARPKDVTLDVEFDAISRAATDRGMKLEGYMSQQRFMYEWREGDHDLKSFCNGLALILSQGI